MARPPKTPRTAALLFSVLTVTGLLGLAGGGRLLLERWGPTPGLDILLGGAPVGAGEPTGWVLMLGFGLAPVIALGGLVLARAWGWVLAGVVAGGQMGWIVARSSAIGLQPFHVFYGALSLLVGLLVLMPPVQRWVYARPKLAEGT